MQTTTTTAAPEKTIDQLRHDAEGVLHAKLAAPDRPRNASDEYYVQFIADRLATLTAQRQTHFDSIHQGEFTCDEITIKRAYSGDIVARLRAVADHLETLKYAAQAVADRAPSYDRPRFRVTAFDATHSMVTIAYEMPREIPPTTDEIRERYQRFIDTWEDGKDEQDDFPF